MEVSDEKTHDLHLNRAFLKTHDFRVKWVICEKETHDFGVKWGILKEKTCDFRLNGVFETRKFVIFA